MVCLSFPSPFFQLVPTQITENLYLGSVDSTKERDLLLERNITGIVSLGAKCILTSKKAEIFVQSWKKSHCGCIL